MGWVKCMDGKLEKFWRNSYVVSTTWVRIYIKLIVFVLVGYIYILTI